ncbi:MAG: hypothetical protein UW11_C0022G0011 [Parcubacteria group bacterium GW2011_GWA2_43_9b]|nr:MAG: hypothetical protein UW11_C0022G0011 [Parcubacteria group bacterium GW2011_GWA2_43_9b]
MPKTLLKLKILFLGSLTTYLLFTAPPALAYELEVKLPGLPASVSDPGEYVRYLFIFGLSLAGFLAVGAVAVGGIKYILAGSSVGNVTDARNLIVGALMGVGLLLGSYLLLYTIDPNLVNLSPRQLDVINVPEPPSPPDSGLTETTGSHGCSSQDSCVAGAACGTSAHCAGRAADIRISNLNDSQKQQVLQTLSQDKCVDQLFYAGWPQYCRAGGGQDASKSKSCADHTDHIHYSVKANCA